VTWFVCDMIDCSLFDLFFLYCDVFVVYVDFGVDFVNVEMCLDVEWLV